MINHSRIIQLKDYLYNDFIVDNVEVDGKAFDDIYDCLDELLRLRQQQEKQKHVLKWRKNE